MLEEIIAAVGAAYQRNQDFSIVDGLEVARVRSGMNNALYRVRAGEREYACKLCVADERRRAHREYTALQLLHAAGADVAPHPVGLDESERLAPYPAVVYVWMDGEALNRSAGDAQLAALRDALQTVHAIEPGDRHPEPVAWFHWFDREQYLAELTMFLDSYRDWLHAQVSGGPELYARLERLVSACIRAVRARTVEISREAVPLRWCHVDPNPANLVWRPDERLCWVDWEYSGWGDPALDLAEYRWHERWDGLSDAQQSWLRENYTPPCGDDRFWERVALWDCLLSCRWPFLALRWLWSAQNGPERLRLTLHDLRVSELRARLERLVRRAEDTNHC